jgi:hypothetical protein
MRLVKRVRGGFNNDVDSAGNHGDTFDAFKLSMHALHCDAGPVEATAVDTRPAKAHAAHSHDPLPTLPPDDENDPTKEDFYA